MVHHIQYYEYQRSNTGNSIEELLRRREECVGKALSIAHEYPLHIIKGEMQYLYSATGEKYLDLVNNVCHVGHSNPKSSQSGSKANGGIKH